MGYLGLDQTVVKEDNLFQRMFWPSDHAGETDALGKQGFWVCWAIAVGSSVVLLISGHWLLAPLIFAFYALGGIGVREHSQVAAILVALAFWMDQVISTVGGHPPGILWIAGGVLLIANIRGTWIADKWACSAEPDAMPERGQGTLPVWLVDQMPRLIWPRGQYVFYAVAGFYMVLAILGVVFLALGAVRHR